MLVDSDGANPGDENATVTILDNEATGAPTISGTAQVGAVLTADTGAIADEQDGLTSPVYTYQWQRVDGSGATDISGATLGHLHPGRR